MSLRCHRHREAVGGIFISAGTIMVTSHAAAIYGPVVENREKCATLIHFLIFTDWYLLFFTHSTEPPFFPMTCFLAFSLYSPSSAKARAQTCILVSSHVYSIQQGSTRASSLHPTQPSLLTQQGPARAPASILVSRLYSRWMAGRLIQCTDAVALE